MHPAYRGNILDILGGEIRLHPSRKGMMTVLLRKPWMAHGMFRRRYCCQPPPSA